MWQRSAHPQRSPVYASDGRLLGAVSYGFTAAPSMIGGMTPAVAMPATTRDANRSGKLVANAPGRAELGLQALNPLGGDDFAQLGQLPTQVVVGDDLGRVEAGRATDGDHHHERRHRLSHVRCRRQPVKGFQGARLMLQPFGCFEDLPRSVVTACGVPQWLSRTSGPDVAKTPSLFRSPKFAPSLQNWSFS